MTTSIRHKPVLFLKAMTALVVLGMLTLALRSADEVVGRPLIDDGFYSLSVARNIAMGNGITIDGEKLTNGFQPLFTFLCSLLYLPFDGERFGPIRLLLVVHSLVQLVTALLFGLVIRDVIADPKNRSLRQWLATALYISGSFVFRRHHNGLETGWALMLYVCAWRYYQAVGIATLGRCAVFGSILGAAVLTRVDAAFLVVLWFLAGMLDKRPFGERFVRAALISGVAFVVSLPWWSYNIWLAGSPMPTSGTSQVGTGLYAFRVEWMVSALLQIATPSGWLGRFENAITLAGRFVFAGLVVWAGVPIIRKLRADTAGRDTPQGRTLHFGLILLVYFTVLMLWYLLQFHAYWFYDRYLSFGALLSFALLAVVLAEHSNRVRKLGLVFIAGTSSVMLLFVYLHHTNRAYAGNPKYLHQLALVTKHVPADAMVTAYQSGTLGYFRERVVNCDGKVNYDVLEYRTRIAEYIDKIGANYWVDDRFFVPGAPGDIAWRKVAQSGTFILYERIDRR